VDHQNRPAPSRNSSAKSPVAFQKRNAHFNALEIARVDLSKNFWTSGINRKGLFVPALDAGLGLMQRIKANSDPDGAGD